MPGLASVAREFESKGVVFYALTVWGDDKDRVAKWLVEFEAEGVKSGQANDAGAKKLHSLVGEKFKGIPSTVVIGADGKIRRIMAASSEEEFREAFAAVAA
jgi:hypothetical protein